MVKARLEKAKRLLDLSRDLQRLEEDRLVQLRNRKAEIAVQQEELIGSLDSDTSLQGLLMPVIVRRLKGLGDEAMLVEQDIERRTSSLRSLATRTKYAERLSRNYQQQHTRMEGEKELLDVIERVLRTTGARLP